MKSFLREGPSGELLQQNRFKGKENCLRIMRHILAEDNYHCDQCEENMIAVANQLRERGMVEELAVVTAFTATMCDGEC